VGTTSGDQTTTVSLVTHRRAARRAAPAVKVVAVQRTSEASTTSEGLTWQGATTRIRVSAACRRQAASVADSDVEAGDAMTTIVASGSSGSCSLEGTESGEP
jgi:hypothetical protein